MHKRALWALSRMLLVVLALGAAAACNGDDGKESSSSTTTSTTLAFTGKGSEEFCSRYQEFRTTNTSESLDPATVPPEELAARWAAIVVALEGMEAAASDEIRADATQLRETVVAIQPALAAAGYDPAAVPEAERTRVGSAAADRASTRLTRYATQICGVEGG